jgi:hypothetical protein
MVLDSNGGGKEARLLFALEFVNMNASSKAEKRQNQKVIRSTAMKNFRRRQQSQRTQAKQASKTGSEMQHQPPTQRTRAENTRNKEGGNDGKQESTEVEREGDPDVQEASSQPMDDCTLQTAFTDAWPGSQTVCSDYNNEDYGDSEAVQVESSLTCPASNDSFSPATILGGGRIDPFRVYPAAYVGPHVHELIDHCESWSPS